MREARATRARTLRRRIVGGSVALFVATWLLITIVLVSGHDPALAHNASTAAVSPSGSSGTATSSGSASATSSGYGSASDGGASSGGDSFSNGASSANPSTSSVTTRQS